MQSKLITALVFGAFASAASAQSSVTLGGIVDAWVGQTRNKVGGVSTTNSLLDSGGGQASRWNLRGTEDLGGGLKASFMLDQGFALVNARRSHIDEYGVWGEDCVHRNVNPQWSRRWNSPQTAQAARHRSGANTAQSSRPAWSNNAANPATPQRRWPSATASTSAWYAAGLS